MTPVTAGADPRNIFAAVPFMRLLDVQRAFSEDGRARLVLEERAELGNVIGAVHGGVVSTLLDVVMASAAVSRRDFTRTAVTLHLDSSFLLPGRGRLVADGEVLQHDEHIAWCRATVVDAHGHLVAQGLGSFRYLPIPSQPDPQGDTPCPS
ncbi:MAG TPA: PaaI family thioesterase [Burkholderiaceae bacterium]|nr:PaaI family thioesterase [Burkholderiaceae bacterium]